MSIRTFRSRPIQAAAVAIHVIAAAGCAARNKKE
jgi:hypothetical protein